MRVFVTGATGFVGSALVPQLIQAGHQVVGLARTDAAAESLHAAGAESVRGSLDDLEILSKAAASADGVIHAGFIHDFSNFVASCETDRRAIEAFGAALAGTNKPLVVTSGTMIASGGSTIATEEDGPKMVGNPRGQSEELALALAEKGVRVSVIRLPPSVHGVGDHAFMPALIGIAKSKGEAAYVGDGSNRWPAVHRQDAVRLYRLALEKAPAGTRVHAVGDEGVKIKDIAGVMGRQLGIPVVSKSAEEAVGHFGFLGHFIAVDNLTSSALTRERFGWTPTQPGLLADLEENYFKV
ncbi:hypothetical protein JAAARDRAFT_638494 [Jaapia argillacea MUCL 33604]|uniref:NAD-dependent epimerase/dehydratase domain-containing protein n=1 Tax=Jaapia argillacea MUCL 33604 TaxID=933084 RepID=A0A067P3V7_9AGAM|nr:hypothetical protein JAAARDRAFT_638494 [Jaapia argillacea MUCL 33604]